MCYAILEEKANAANLQSYIGDSLECLSERPNASDVAVQITILEAPKVSNGAAMAAALQQFVDQNQTSSFPDPLDWQKETRTDRNLPNRETI